MFLVGNICLIAQVDDRYCNVQIGTVSWVSQLVVLVQSAKVVSHSDRAASALGVLATSRDREVSLGNNFVLSWASKLGVVRCCNRGQGAVVTKHFWAAVRDKGPNVAKTIIIYCKSKRFVARSSNVLISDRRGRLQEDYWNCAVICYRAVLVTPSWQSQGFHSGWNLLMTVGYWCPQGASEDSAAQVHNL